MTRRAPRAPLTEVIELADGLQLVVRITSSYTADVELDPLHNDPGEPE